MRKYQRKHVEALAELYRSKDALRWVYIASRLGVDRKMTNRERRILIRRMAIDIKKVAKALGQVLDGVVKTVQDAVAAIVAALGGNNLHIDHIAPIGDLPGLAASGKLVNTRIVDGAVNNVMGVGNVKS